jgi:hypothetical protein
MHICTGSRCDTKLYFIFQKYGACKKHMPIIWGFDAESFQFGEVSISETINSNQTSLTKIMKQSPLVGKCGLSNCVIISLIHI